MKKNMNTRFFFLFAHVASIRHLPSALFELIWVKILAQVASQAKKITLVGAKEFQTILWGKGSTPLLAKEE